MHGMTGDASMMRPFAEKILPEGWTLIVPEARYSHPRRGRTWWRYEDEDADATRRMTLSRRELIDVDSSLSQLEQLIAEHAPLGPLVVGGFSKDRALKAGSRLDAGPRCCHPRILLLHRSSSCRTRGT